MIFTGVCHSVQGAGSGVRFGAGVLDQRTAPPPPLLAGGIEMGRGHGWFCLVMLMENFLVFTKFSQFIRILHVERN